MNEIGLYALATKGAEIGRLTAIARWLPNAVAYTEDHPTVRAAFAHHNITTTVPDCRCSDCYGMTPACIETWVTNRNPHRLVVPTHPYGSPYQELVRYVQARRDTIIFLARPGQVPSVDTTTLLATIEAGTAAALPFDATELPTRAHARNLLLGATDRPMVVIAGPEHFPRYRDAVVRLCESRGIDHALIADYPTMPAMVGADLVVGYAGFLQDEAQAIGVPMQALVDCDDQTNAWRANATYRSVSDAIAGLKVRDVPVPPDYTNTARHLAELIAGARNGN
jgi:hypothetical protein